MEFELAYSDSALHRFNYSTTKTTPVKFSIKNKFLKLQLPY